MSYLLGIDEYEYKHPAHPHLREIERVLKKIAFRDYEIHINYDGIVVTTLVPDSKNDPKYEKEDSQRRWHRCNPKVGSVSKWIKNRSESLYAQYDRLGVDANKSLYPETEELRGAIPVMHYRPFPIEGFKDENDIVEFIFKAIMQVEEHEAKENFYYKGLRIYDPHKGV